MSEDITIRYSITTLKVFKIFGIACFTIENRKPTTKLWDLFYLVNSVLIGISFLYMLSIYHDKLIVSKSEIVDMGNYVTYNLTLLTDIIVIMLMFVFRYEIWNLILNMHEIENKFKSIGRNEDFSKVAVGILGIFSAIVALSIPIAIITYNLHGSLLNTGLSFYSGMYFVLIVGMVISFIQGMIIRMQIVYRVLESINRDRSYVTAVVDNNSRNDGLKIIRTLIEIYSKIIQLQETVSICLGVQTMLLFGLLFFCTILTNFIVIKNLSTDGFLSGSTVSGIIITSYYHVFVTAIIHVCNQTEIEAKKILKLINAIMKSSKDSTKVAMLLSLSFLIKRNPLKFSCGFFYFDWNLAYSVSLKTSEN